MTFLNRNLTLTTKRWLIVSYVVFVIGLLTYLISGAELCITLGCLPGIAVFFSCLSQVIKEMVENL